MPIRSFITGLVLAGITANLAAQNTGIGTISPTRAKLELNGAVGNTNAIFGAGANGIGLVYNWPNLEFNAYYNQGHRYIGNGYALVQNLNPGNGMMVFEPNASGIKDALITGVKSALSISSDGRVGIGFNPGYNAQLNVGKDADKDCSAFFSAPQWSAFNYTSSEYTAIRSGANLASLYLNYYAQNSKIAIGVEGSMVGINSGAPIYPLEIRAPDFCIALMRMGSLNQWIMTVSQYYLKLFFLSTTANNNITQLGAFDYNTGQYSASSDRRLKKHIEPLPPMLGKILQLQPCRYEMKFNNPNHDTTIGLVAQDVKEIFPSLVHVTQNANTGYENIKDVHTLNYSGFAPMIIKALQEQQLQLLQLEERTARLENH
jgi:hypothetical protein